MIHDLCNYSFFSTVRPVENGLYLTLYLISVRGFLKVGYGFKIPTKLAKAPSLLILVHITTKAEQVSTQLKQILAVNKNHMTRVLWTIKIVSK